MPRSWRIDLASRQSPCLAPTGQLARSMPCGRRRLESLHPDSRIALPKPLVLDLSDFLGVPVAIMAEDGRPWRLEVWDPAFFVDDSMTLFWTRARSSLASGQCDRLCWAPRDDACMVSPAAPLAGNGNGGWVKQGHLKPGHPCRTSWQLSADQHGLRCPFEMSFQKTKKVGMLFQRAVFVTFAWKMGNELQRS